MRIEENKNSIYFIFLWIKIFLHILKKEKKKKTEQNEISKFI